MAKLYFRYGAMGSSKTANAIMVRHNYLERGQRVLMLKPRLDNRDGETMIASRSGLRCHCHFIEDLDRFNVRDYDCLIVDEAQFLTRAQVERLVRAGLGRHHRGGQDHLLVRQKSRLQRARGRRQGGPRGRTDCAGRQRKLCQPLPPALGAGQAGARGAGSWGMTGVFPLCIIIVYTGPDHLTWEPPIPYHPLTSSSSSDAPKRCKKPNSSSTALCYSSSVPLSSART